MSTVSIIIPTHNRGHLLREAVYSCLEQADVDVDVIVVDDGSSDGSAKDTKILYPQITLVEQTRQGACAARNHGLFAARGQFIKFLDSDDLLAPGVLYRQVRNLEQSSADVIYGDMEFIGNLADRRVGGVARRVIGLISDFVDEMLADTKLFSNFIYLYRIDAIKNLRWNTNLECLQDVDFTLQVAMSGARFKYEPGVTGYYRIHTGQITSQSLYRYAVNRCRLLDRARIDLLDRGMLTDRRRYLMAHGYWLAARAFYREDRSLFRETLQRIEDLVPGFRPDYGDIRMVRWLTRLLGIESAEKVLEVVRRVRRLTA